MSIPTSWRAPTACVGLLVLIALVYWPGLSGPFFFDDFGNLDVLGAYGSPGRWPGLLYYLTSGNADPIGRPLSLLTFLFDAQQWPADPWPFKRTNLVIHLVNTGLLAWTITRLQAGLRRRQPGFVGTPLIPLTAAGLWGAHPFFVSTTLYVVQREAMLPLTFCLLALLAWDMALQRFAQGRAGAGWRWGVLGVGIATILATLSKANGALVPTLVGIAHVCCLRSAEREAARPGDRAAWLCLGGPTLLLLIWLVHFGAEFWPLGQIAGRDWTIRERLLSESRAVWTYVGHLLLPRAGGGGLFVDDFAASRGWFVPISTLPAVIALLASLVAAVLARRRHPVLCFAWLFFLGGHLLESTVVPLELYFEHRNYLPAAFLGWPIAHVLLREGSYARYRLALASLLFAAFLLLTWQRASAWGNGDLMQALTTVHAVDSPRAQVEAAASELRRGQTAAGLARIRAAQAAHPDSVDVAISAIGLQCQAVGEVPPASFDATVRTLETVQTWNYALYDWLEGSLHDARLMQCSGFGLDGTEHLIVAAEHNHQSRLPSRRRDLWHLRGQLALARHQPDVALRWFNAALAVSPAPEPDYALAQAAALGEASAPALGVQHLDAFSRTFARRPRVPVRDMISLHVWVLRRYGYYEKEIARLRGILAQDAEQRTEHGDA